MRVLLLPLLLTQSNLQVLSSDVSYESSGVIVEGSGYDASGGSVIEYIAVDEVFVPFESFAEDSVEVSSVPSSRNKRSDDSAKEVSSEEIILPGGVGFSVKKEDSGNISIEELSPLLRKTRNAKTQSVQSGVSAAYVALKEDMDRLKTDGNALDQAVHQLEMQQLNNDTANYDSGLEMNTTSQCETVSVCYEDSDCNGGRCLGAYVGTCNCNSCMNYWKCSSDDDCGGFNRACNLTLRVCDCFGAYVLNGFSNTLDALGRMCNVKQCGRDTQQEECFGLPCNTGRCFC